MEHTTKSSLGDPLSKMGSLRSETNSQSPVLDLLVIQPSPFCNLNCSYCYLPDRGNTKKISMELLDTIFQRVFSSSIATRPFTIAWHAGEPLVLPISFYEQAFALAQKYNRNNIKITHTFQTNGTTINSDWCKFFRDHEVKVGLSIDGPEFLHDLNRKRRNGTGTHQRVMESVRLLHAENIPFSVISVLTATALDHPDELFEFYRDEKISSIGFNIEEVEAAHQSSSMQFPDAKKKYARFLNLTKNPDASANLSIREIDQMDRVLSHFKSNGSRPEAIGKPRNQEATPMAILNVDYLGNFSTFSPELLGIPSKQYGDFSLGNMQTISIDEAIESEKYKRMVADVRAGISKCEQSCGYYSFCGGGSPGNKYYENGTFDSTKTMVCALSKKIRVDVLKHKHGIEIHEQPKPEIAFNGLFTFPKNLRDYWWQNVAEKIQTPDKRAIM